MFDWQRVILESEDKTARRSVYCNKGVVATGTGSLGTG